MKPFLPLPPELDQKFQLVAVVNESLMLERQYDQAREGFQQLYDLLVRQQPTDGRYHKGYPLHQIGTALVLSGKRKDAREYFLLAYIEDLLSQEEGQEDKADEMPAGKTLRQAYRVQNAALSRLKDLLRQNKSEERVIHDAKVFFDQLREALRSPRVSPEVATETRKAGQFKSDWEQRVFVGGNYKEIVILNEIKEFVSRLGYDPVLARDFEIAEGMAHRYSLMLLHECSKAIFDISVEAGQLMEIERLRDYQITPLIVYQSSVGKEPPKVTEMLRALLGSLGFEPKPYAKMEELESLITGYLPGRAI